MILLTGGAGFIGSNTLAALNQRGMRNIILVDNLNSQKKILNIKKMNYEHFIPKNELWSWLAKNNPNLSLIIHFGACTNTTENNMDYLKTNNIEYSKKLWGIATERHIPFVYASSAATYGAGHEGFSDAHDYLGRFKPLNKYGLSKHIFDRWVLNKKDNPPNWAGLKFFNVFGPNEYHKKNMASAIHKFILQAKDNGSVKLFKGSHGFADGEQKRDFIFVDDVVDVVLWFCFSSPTDGIYNVGTGVATSFNTVAKVISEKLGNINIKYIDFPEGLLNIYQPYTKSENEKLIRAGYKKEFHGIQEGIELTINRI